MGHGRLAGVSGLTPAPCRQEFSPTNQTFFGSGQPVGRWSPPGPLAKGKLPPL